MIWELTGDEIGLHVSTPGGASFGPRDRTSDLFQRAAEDFLWWKSPLPPCALPGDRAFRIDRRQGWGSRGVAHESWVCRALFPF